MIKLRVLLGLIFVILGGIMFFISIFSMYRFKYVLTRLTGIGLADTSGLALVIFGLIVSGVNFFTGFKLILILVFFWATSPIVTHMIARVEILTNPKYLERIKEND